MVAVSAALALADGPARTGSEAAVVVVEHAAVALDAPDARASTRVNAEALREITGPTGGYTEVVHSAEDLGPATERIAYELNHQYTIGYAPQRPPDGSWRMIRVRVKDGEYLARSRRGYFADPAH